MGLMIVFRATQRVELECISLEGWTQTCKSVLNLLG